MKVLGLMLVMCMLATQVLATEITFTIPDEKLPRVVAAMKGLFGEAPDLNQDGQPDFNDNQWAKEVVRMWIVSQVNRWERSVAAKEAAALIQPDNTVAQ